MRKTEEAARRFEALASRYELTRVDGGGVLFDSETGQIMALNITAAEIWSRSLAGETPDDIATGLARTYQVDPNSVRGDVARTLVVPPHVAPETIDDFRYEVTPDGKYVAATDEGPVLELAAAGDRVDVLRPTSPSTLESYLCSVAPKLLALSGQVVLHASSVRYGSEAIAFLGASGAGKTTTAHAFAAAGDATVMAEDMLLVSMVNGKWSALNAEPRVRAWAPRAVSQRAGDEIPFEPWPADQNLESAKLVAFHFVDRLRRRGTTVDPSPLSVAETAARLFGNSFVSSLAPEARSRHLAQVLSMARTIPGYELSLPEGLDPLREATSQHLRIWRTARGRARMTRPSDAEDDWIPAPEVTSREVASGMILVNLDSGNCWQINATGSAFWKALTRLGSVPAAVEEVAATFGDKRDQVAEDVRRFAQELANAGALIKRPPGGTTP